MADGGNAATAAAAAAAAGVLPLEGIAHPGLNDVMFGRGGDTNYHIGNHRFRVLADDHRRSYRSSSRKEKAIVVMEVVRIWRARGGRFLTKTEPEKGDDSVWHDVGDAVAKKKAAKILSEKAPEERKPRDDGDDNNGGGGGAGGKGRNKRPAVDSIDADRGAAVKQPTLLPAGGAGGAAKQPPLATNMASTTTGVVALLTGAAANVSNQQQQQQPPPVAAPLLQLPLQLPLATQAQNALQQSLHLPIGSGLPSNQQALADLLLAQRPANPLLTNPLVLAALGLNPTNSTTSQIILAAQALLQRHEQGAARTRALLAHALILQTVNTNQRISSTAARNLVAATTTTATTTNNNSNSNTHILDSNVLATATRAGLSSEELRLLLLINGVGQGNNSSNNHSQSNNNNNEST